MDEDYKHVVKKVEQSFNGTWSWIGVALSSVAQTIAVLFLTGAGSLFIPRRSCTGFTPYKRQDRVSHSRPGSLKSTTFSFHM